MKKHIPFSLFFAIMLFPFLLAAQHDYRILLQSGTMQPEVNVDAIQPAPYASEIYNGYYYRLIQFTKIPSDETKAAMKQSGLVLLDYIPYNTFITAIPDRYDLTLLKGFGVRSILKQDKVQKINFRILGSFPDYAIHEKGTADVVVQYYKNISPETAITSAAAKGKILGYNKTNHTINLRISDQNLMSLASEPWLFYINAVSPPSVPDDTKGRSLHRSNVINSDYATGRHYDGSGVVASLADDGEVGLHIDFTGRMTNHLTGAGGTHGDMTSGILAGAGNLNPVIRGMGTGAYLHVFDINNYTHIIDAVNYYNTLGSVITSTSYSQGCNEYTNDSQFGDQLIHENPQLEFVFSAGNNGGGNCGYGAGAGWGNITGGYKTGKNVIACGNLSELEVLDPTSSRGPASDGRIKPDICSNGLNQLSTDQDNTYQTGGGTSAACPGIAGVLTQLYQAYKELRGGGQNPPSALIKAALLNSAEDIGNPGPDYTYGWGRVNAFRALKVIEDSTYRTNNVADGGFRLHLINVPANVNQLRVMIYWSDPEASPLSAKALVNDLDMTLVDPTFTPHTPWTLNPAPSAATLNAPAVTGTDSLNNMEQITIDNPVAGIYGITINGSSVPVGPQTYYVVYEYRTNEITLTYPIGGEGFVPGEQEVIRWDAVKGLGTYTLEYSTDNGVAWNPIATNINTNVLQYAWTVPNSVTGDALVRVSRGTDSDVSDTTFTIIRTPTNISIGFACPDSIHLTWNPVAGATGYTIYKLGSKYMDPIGTSTTTDFMVLAVNPTEDTWFSVCAKAANGQNGRRALAIHKSPGTSNCPLGIDALITITNPVSGTLQSCQDLSAISVDVLILNNGQNPLTDIPVVLQLDGSLIVTDTVFGTLAPAASVTHTFSLPVNLSATGGHTISAWSNYTGDLNIYNDTSKVSMDVLNVPLASLPFNEDFESFSLCSTNADCGATVCGLNNGWLNETNGSQDDVDFRTSEGSTPSTNTGPDVDHTTGTPAGNYLYIEASTCFSQQANLVSPCVDLTSSTAPFLHFWYHMFGADMGTLHLDIYADGTWTNDIMPALSGDYGNSWLQQSVDLTAWAGKIVNLRFRGVTGAAFASDMAIDDITIIESNAPPLPAFVADMSLGCVGSTVTFTDESLNNPTSWSWSFVPSTVTYVNGTSATSQNPQVQFAQGGLYDVTLLASNSFGGNSVTHSASVEIQLPAALDITEDFEGVSFPPAKWKVLTSPGGAAFTWSKIAGITGSNGSSTSAAWVNNFDYNNIGAEDGLASIEVDLTGTIIPAMTFDVSYARYDGTTDDGLRIDVSTDCGATYVPSGYLKSGTALATYPDTAGIYTPYMASQWRNDTVDLSAWIGQDVIVKFVNINAFGNNLYIDNINISDIVGIEHPDALNGISVYPNPSSGIFNLEMHGVKTTEMLMTVLDIEGRIVWQQETKPSSEYNRQIDLHSMQKGIYFLQLKSNEGTRIFKLTVM